MKSEEPNSEPSPRRVQFGIRSLLLIMLLVSVLAAIGAGLVARGGKPKGPLVIMAVAAPMGAMIVLSLLETVIRGVARFQQRRRPRATDSDDEDFR